MNCSQPILNIVVGLLTALIADSCCLEVCGQIERSPETTAALEYQFSPSDERLLDEIQRGCFEFLWQEVGNPAPLVKDRLTNDKVSSLAGVGFQLSAIPIGVQRGWITRDQGEQRALGILRAIIPRADNKKFGIYLHYVDLNTGGMHNYDGAQVMASTIDHALLQAGAMTAAVYFGGEVETLAGRLVSEANWKAYEVELNENVRRRLDGKSEKFISFGWLPDDRARDLNVSGSYRPWSWYKASDEELIVTFLAVGSPVVEHAVDPEMYYRLHRIIKQHEDMPPFVVSWGGPAFCHFFAHCWIDYGRFGTDDPAAFSSNEPQVDWFENSRRAMLTHRQRCLEATDRFKTFGENRWGMSPAADINDKGEIGYIVPSVKPSMEDRDNFCGGYRRAVRGWVGDHVCAEGSGRSAARIPQSQRRRRRVRRMARNR